MTSKSRFPFCNNLATTEIHYIILPILQMTKQGSSPPRPPRPPAGAPRPRPPKHQPIRSLLLLPAPALLTYCMPLQRIKGRLCERQSKVM